MTNSSLLSFHCQDPANGSPGHLGSSAVQLPGGECLETTRSNPDKAAFSLLPFEADIYRSICCAAISEQFLEKARPAVNCHYKFHYTFLERLEF